MGDGVIIENVIYEHLESFIAKLEEMGVGLTIREDSIEVHKSENLKSVNITSVPYPGFATDLQQPITPLLLKAKVVVQLLIRFIKNVSIMSLN